MKLRVCWLDDMRSPYEPPHSSMVTALLTDDITERVSPAEIIWVKNYEEFIEEITNNGLPDILSLDHDLAQEHYAPPERYDDYNQWVMENTFSEKTGYDCAHWLVNYCLDNKLKLPEITQCHSQNPAGKKNITTLLTNFRRQ